MTKGGLTTVYPLFNLGGWKANWTLMNGLIDFASGIIDIAEALPKTVAGHYLAGQLVRSGTAPCLQYGEAQSAESGADFIHKMKMSAKELRETYRC
jgi:four helix bundle protein